MCGAQSPVEYIWLRSGSRTALTIGSTVSRKEDESLPGTKGSDGIPPSSERVERMTPYIKVRPFKNSLRLSEPPSLSWTVIIESLAVDPDDLDST